VEIQLVARVTASEAMSEIGLTFRFAEGHLVEAPPPPQVAFAK
jgi:hypothetical protein